MIDNESYLQIGKRGVKRGVDRKEKHGEVFDSWVNEKEVCSWEKL